MTFSPDMRSTELRVDIKLEDENINEAQEGFFVVLNVQDSSSNEAGGEKFQYERRVSLVRINDNDRKC